MRYALRGLVRSPGFSLTVIATFALGVGANAAIFSLLDPLLLRTPAGVDAADRVHRVYAITPGSEPSPLFSGATYSAFREALTGLARVAPKLSADSVWMGDASGGVSVLREFATASYLPIVAGRPALGRFFTLDETDITAPLPRVVLSHALWQQAFASDPTTIGKDLLLGGVSHVIVGIAPERFRGIDLTPVDLWATPTHLSRTPEPWYRWSNQKFGSLLMRVDPGTDVRQVEARATAAYRRELPPARDEAYAPSILLGSIVEGRGPVASKEVRISTRVAGVALIVFLIACANVATLSLVRAARRRRETAVRIALGISRARLASQQLAETLLLSAAGCAAALLVAGWAGAALRVVLMPETAFSSSVLSTRVIVAAIGMTVVAAVLSGVIPAFIASRPNVGDVLKGVSRFGPSGRVLREGLIVAQVTLSIVLSVGAGLFLRSLRNLHAIDLGLDPTRTIVSNIRPATSAGFADAMENLAARIRQLPGVEHVGLGSSGPYVFWDAGDAFLPGQDTSVILGGERPAGVAVDTAYIAALGLRLRSGRSILPSDLAGSSNIVVVDENMARKLWPQGNAIGQCLIPYSRENPCFTVVGIVNDLHQFSLIEAPRMRYYIPANQLVGMNRLPTTIVARTSPDRADAVASFIHDEMQRAFPTARVMWPAAPIAQRLEPELRPWRVGTGLFLALGVIALIVATIGTYSVIAYTFSQRTREIGIRMAVGAQAADVRNLVLGNALRIVGIGVGLGIALALVLGRFVSALLYGVSSRDPVTMVGSAAVLVVAGTLAGLLPAWRASRLDPVRAVKAD